MQVPRPVFDIRDGKIRVGGRDYNATVNEQQATLGGWVNGFPSLWARVRGDEAEEIVRALQAGVGTLPHPNYPAAMLESIAMRPSGSLMLSGDRFVPVSADLTILFSGSREFRPPATLTIADLDPPFPPVLDPRLIVGHVGGCPSLAYAPGDRAVPPGRRLFVADQSRQSVIVRLDETGPFWVACGYDQFRIPAPILGLNLGLSTLIQGMNYRLYDAVDDRPIGELIGETFATLGGKRPDYR